MDKQQSHNDEIRQLRLPSGKQIEVVVFGAGEGTTAAPPAPCSDLHRCPECESALVHPVDWEEVAGDCWHLELRCPNCEWHGEGTYDRAVVEDLDEQLETGMEAIVRDLRHLTHANMEEHVERFIAALRCDAITPFDF